MCIFILIYVYPMRTNIVINDDLMNEARALSGNKTKKSVVEEALRLLIQMKKQAGVQSLYGKLDLRDDINRTRTAR